MIQSSLIDKKILSRPLSTFGVKNELGSWKSFPTNKKSILPSREIKSGDPS
jgi:hypothetical protein